MTRPIVLATALLALLAPAGATAADLAGDVTRVQSAVRDLSDAKRAAKGEVPRRERRAVRALAKCRINGPGWERIRAVNDPSQRNAYARGARILWRNLNDVARTGAALETYRPAFERFLARFERPMTDPVLQAGIDALRGRIAYLEGAYGFGTCRRFERLLRRVREYRVGGDAGVGGDYRAGRIFNTFKEHVSAEQRRADRRHGGSTYARRLDAAEARLVELGGDPGYAAYFSGAWSLKR
jgi:hypothetical protein